MDGQYITEWAKQLTTLIYNDDFCKLKYYLDGFNRQKRKECVDHIVVGSTALLKACELERYNFIKYLVEECEADVNIASSARGFPPLYIACALGDLYMSEFLINHGANIHWKDAEMRSYLMVFIENGSLCRFFISKGIDMTHHDLYSKCAFTHAMEKSAFVSLEMLIKCGIDINQKLSTGETSITIACKKSKPDLLYFLIRNGGDIHYVDGCKRTYLMNYIVDNKICEILIQNGITINAKDNCGRTALHYAVLEYAYSSVPLLLKNDADVFALDEEGMSPLHVAISKYHIDMVPIFLSCGSDPNSRDSTGKSIIQSAIDRKDAFKTTYLQHVLNYGGNVNAVDDLGRTGIHYAVCVMAGEQFYALLLKFGAKINSKTFKGQTPLHLAVENNNINCCNFLLFHGSDVNCTDEDGRTPLHYAVTESTSEMITLLCKYDADTNAVDKDGIGPIHEAAIVNKPEFVEDFLQHLDIFNISKIESYELMAADSFIRGTFEEGFEYLRLAITWREANGLTEKPITILNSFLDNIREPESLQTLESLNDDEETMLKQAVIIKSRIYGPCHSEVVEILQRITDEIEHVSTKTLLKIKQHVLQCEMKDCGGQFEITCIMEEIIRIFNELDTSALTYFDIKSPIATIMYAYEQIITLGFDKDLDDLVRITALSLYRCFSVCSNIECERGIRTLRKYFRRFFEICPEKEIVTILFKEIHDDSLCSKAIQTFVETAILYRFPTNVVDFYDSTPLHLLLKSMEFQGIDMDTEYTSIVDLLLKTGTHLCQRNWTGSSVLELLGSVEYPVCPVRDRSLQCLAAEVIMNAEIPFEEAVPAHLIPFILYHRECAW